ncbi:selenocysteine-specific translation elongation factor [Pullulanibacillus pueri]|uniref:Selenocysteine-specific elongation factor n=1 Tax=Pullulanibacillus pueri TaxID=1437324 RepID=A0A8J2ZW37_9BACL|nr:selenocysteine-specific translation elongation factor [Pullulanibacillus pueri]
MDERYYTLGMAGHIDHGKTALTKALTGIDTDRLQAEKERGISIELGYAPFNIGEDVQVSIVDVPGHERFIRQMIAGVAGIDLVMIVLAADEGVMPQTREHIEILKFLGIHHAVVVVTKIDRSDEALIELVTEDIKETLKDTVFSKAPMVYVDSLSGQGIENLKNILRQQLKQVERRQSHTAFRLPIDQVLTIHGHGTVVRGTIYDGIVQKGETLTVLPLNKTVRARQIQVHHQSRETAKAGQRTAVNLTDIETREIKRGDVLVNSEFFSVSKTLDVTVQFLASLSSPLKQRGQVKVHIGTAEVMGTIVFFDRKEVKDEAAEVLCQLRLTEDVVVRRGDRFILRRPSPAETVGGGWVIQPQGEKYRFGAATIERLQQLKAGTPEFLVEEVLRESKASTLAALVQQTGLTEQEVQQVIATGVKEETILRLFQNEYCLNTIFVTLKAKLIDELRNYHNVNPMKVGMKRAELVTTIRGHTPKGLIEAGLKALIAEKRVRKQDDVLALADFRPHLPEKNQVNMQRVITTLQKDGLQVEDWEHYAQANKLSETDQEELALYLTNTGQAYWISEHLLIHADAYEKALKTLKTQTAKNFVLKEAKEALGVSRKYLIPFLELLDLQGLTVRDDGKRQWKDD